MHERRREMFAEREPGPNRVTGQHVGLGTRITLRILATISFCLCRSIRKENVPLLAECLLVHTVLLHWLAR